VNKSIIRQCNNKNADDENSRTVATPSKTVSTQKQKPATNYIRLYSLLKQQSKQISRPIGFSFVK